MSETVTDLLLHTEKLFTELEFVPESLSQYLELTKKKISEVLTLPAAAASEPTATAEKVVVEEEEVNET